MSAEEVWRPVPGFDGYFVSNIGRVRSFKRPNPRILRGGISQDGYHTVRLYDAPQQSVTECVHRLVARAFLGPRPEGLEVRHLNGVKLDNSAANLVYGTRSENQMDNIAHGVNPNTAKTGCINGHPYSADNTYLHRGRHRQCRTCRRAAKARYRTRLAFAAANVPTASAA